MNMIFRNNIKNVIDVKKRLKLLNLLNIKVIKFVMKLMKTNKDFALYVNIEPEDIKFIFCDKDVKKRNKK